MTSPFGLNPDGKSGWLVHYEAIIEVSRSTKSWTGSIWPIRGQSCFQRNPLFFSFFLNGERAHGTVQCIILHPNYLLLFTDDIHYFHDYLPTLLHYFLFEWSVKIQALGWTVFFISALKVEREKHFFSSVQLSWNITFKTNDDCKSNLQNKYLGMYLCLSKV